MTLANKLGLHARPAARLVSTLAEFKSDVRIRFGERVVNARSLNKIVTLGSRQGDSLTFQASGQDADAAIEAIQQLAAENFGDKYESQDSPQPLKAGTQLVSRVEGFGIPTSEGIALGPVVIWGSQLPTVAGRSAADSEFERARLRDALAAIQKELVMLQRQTERTAGVDESIIFEAQRLMLGDPELIEQALSLIHI